MQVEYIAINQYNSQKWVSLYLLTYIILLSY